MEERDDWFLTDAVGNAQGQSDPFAAVVRGARLPMVIADAQRPDQPIVFANAAFQSMTGYAREEIVGRNCRFLQGPATDRSAVRRLREAIASGVGIELDILNYRRDGTTFWNALQINPVRDNAGGIRFYVASQSDVTSRVELQVKAQQQMEQIEQTVAMRTADLEAALAAKTMLVHEVDHRVKNNLTMIGSLLRLQSRGLADEAVKRQLDTMLSRVNAIASVHRRLYQTGDIMEFDIGAFSGELAREIVAASGRTDIRIDTQIEPIVVPSGKAAALGLVLNEIVTNALMHAWRGGRPGKLSIASNAHDDFGTIAIADDGPGLDAFSGPSGLGHSIIKRLAAQAGGTARWEDARPGARVVVSFPIGAAP